MREAASPFAVLVLRLALGSIMAAHGWMKVHHGMFHHVQSIQSLGMPAWLAYASAWAEFGGGILVLIGLLTRIASLAILVTMIVAIVKVIPTEVKRSGGILCFSAAEQHKRFLDSRRKPLARNDVLSRYIATREPR